METYESNTTSAVAVVADDHEADKPGRSGWKIRAVLVTALIAAVPAYVLLQPKNCQPANSNEEDFSLREARYDVEVEPEMAMSWDAENELTSTCTSREPPNFWEHYTSKPLWVENHSCDLIVRNGQCWWAVASPHWMCRKACGMCRDTQGCDDAQPPQWWQQKTCAEVVQRGDCWWATKDPLNLCRRSCNACTTVDNCYDREPPAHWTSPASSCHEISTTEFYGETQCSWASLAPHNLCRKTCGRCENSQCPRSGCSKGLETGSTTVVLFTTHFYQTSNSLNQHIIRIPAGSVNVHIKSDSHWPTHEWNSFALHSDKDLDVCLRDEVHPHCRALREPCRNYGAERCSYLNDCIVGTKCGQVVADHGGTGTYKNMQITYSGDDNINKIYTQNSVNNDGFETITIRGPTTTDLYVDVSSDTFSKGQVSWKFERCDGSCTGYPNTPRPTPEPTSAPVECDDVPPPAFWTQNSCSEVRAQRQCQWAAYPPRNFCRASCGVCRLPGQLVAPLAYADDDEPIEDDEDELAAPLNDGADSLEVQPDFPVRRRLADARRRLADECKPKYPLWPGLVIFGSAALFVAFVPSKWISSKNKGDEAKVDPDFEAPRSSSCTIKDDDEPEVVVFARGKKKPSPPKLKALRKISSSGDLSGRQASLPKITPRRAPTLRSKGEWSF